jgi:glycerophosphoryl diester phosphodiesterase
MNKPRVDQLLKRPIAHRGLHNANAGRPENSLPAFEHSCARGYPIELDVRLSADDKLVVFHDASLTRLAGVDLSVRDLSMRELADHRLLATDHHIPELPEVLQLVDGQVPLLIEIKAGVEDSRRSVDRLAGVMDSYRGEYAVQSFNPYCVAWLRRSIVAAPVGQIAGMQGLIGFASRSLVTNFATQPDFVSFELQGLPNVAASFWRQRGRPIIAWTIRSTREEAQARELADNFAFEDYEPELAR